MNIHINKNHLSYLKDQAIFSTPIGSQLYGTATELSDTDLLYVYPESLNELNNPFINHHQFQIKEGNTDHIFTTIKQFVQNLIQGDSTINIDVLMLTDIEKTIPVFEQLKKEISTCYPILKAILGFAKRDLKISSSQKKLNHAKRGLYCFEHLREKGFFTKEDIQTILKMDVSRDTLHEAIKTARVKLNEDFNQKKLKSYFSLDCQIAVVDFLTKLNRAEENSLLIEQLKVNGQHQFFY